MAIFSPSDFKPVWEVIGGVFIAVILIVGLKILVRKLFKKFSEKIKSKKTS